MPPLLNNQSARTPNTLNNRYPSSYVNQPNKIRIEQGTIQEGHLFIYSFQFSYPFGFSS